LADNGKSPHGLSWNWEIDLNLSEVLAGKPPVRAIPNAPATIRKELIASNKRLAVVDDDPTGVQTIHDVSVYMRWSVDVLRKALASGDPVFFISTNSRALSPEEAKALSLEVGRNLGEATRREGREVLLASRSDSTLRGHFPYEVDALAEGMALEFDGIIIAPAFFEGGRFTIDDIQWVEQDGQMIPAHLTEFARDPAFAFKNSNLKAWVTEKTKGAVEAEDVRSISLDLLREGGPEAVAGELIQASGGRPIIANAACYADLEVLALGIQEAEKKGKKFVYRCAASFIKARGGFENRPLLRHAELAPAMGPAVIVVGSYVDRTTRQLRRVLESGTARGVELSIRELLLPGSRAAQIQQAVDGVNGSLASGFDTVLYTSREMLNAHADTFQEAGKAVMAALCEVVSRIEVRPGYLVAKGGITSIELARTSLNVNEAFALGQILPGVPVLRFGAGSRWPDIPYVVFPGNVGDDDALLKVISILTSPHPGPPSSS
jgi:uncharacterized protein YgbK (DUF1537 family)